MAAVLITRPLPAALELRTALALRGIAAVIAPLLRYESNPAPAPDLAACRAVIFTSAAGVEHLPLSALPETWPAWPCYCVGAVTAQQAARRGWRNRIVGGDDGLALAARIMADQAAPAHFLQPCGIDHRPEPAAALTAAGHSVMPWPVYRALAAERLPQSAQAALRDGTLFAVTLFSPRTAQIFTSLVESAGLAPHCAGLTALCLSPQIAAAATALPWRACVSAAAPTEAALLSGLQNLLRR